MVRNFFVAFGLLVGLASPAYSQEFLISGYNSETHSLVVTASDGRSITVPLSVHNTKAKIVTFLQTFNVPVKPTIPPGIAALIGKRFDNNGNELP